MNEGRFVGPCYHCKCAMWLPHELYVSAKHSEKITFYCAFGHPQVFAQGDSQLTIMQRERDRLAQQVAQKNDEIANWKDKAGQALAASEKLVKQAKIVRRRVSNGTCPCCNRTFKQLAAHMANKHKEYVQ